MHTQDILVKVAVVAVAVDAVVALLGDVIGRAVVEDQHEKRALNHVQAVLVDPVREEPPAPTPCGPRQSGP